jgi:hypothetical protein
MAAPKKQKHPGGRPLLYKTPEEMQVAVNAYFESCWDEIDKDGSTIRMQVKPYTMSGLANSLGMCRKSLINYSNKDEFLPTLKKAREKVHQFVEEYLFQGKNTAGAIFNLKNNFGWKDQFNHNLSGGLKVVSHDPISKPKNSGNE